MWEPEECCCEDIYAGLRVFDLEAEFIASEFTEEKPASAVP